MEHFGEELIKNCEIDDIIFPARKIISRSDKKNAEEIGIVMEGTAFLESIDENGIRRVLDYYTAGDIFRRNDYTIPGNTEYFLYARTRCRIGFLSWEKMQKFITEKNAVREITEMFNRGISRQIIHVHMLEQRTMRQKIMAFLEEERRIAGRNPFTMRISFTDCADYIAVDRSAMMREISNMERDGLLKRKGRFVRLTDK